MNFRFKLVHVPGIRNKVADATSRYPTKDMEPGVINEEKERLTRSVLRASTQNIETEDLEDTKRIEEEVEGVIEAAVLAMNGASKQCEALSVEDIAKEAAKDDKVLELIEVIRSGVGTDRSL